MLCVANLSQTAQAVELDLSKYKGRVPVELMGRNAFPPIGDLPYFLTLPAHGFFWLLLSDSAAPPVVAHRAHAGDRIAGARTDRRSGDVAAGERPRRWSASTVRRTLQHLEQEVLPEFLRPRSWFTRHMGVAGFGAARRTHACGAASRKRSC